MEGFEEFWKAYPRKVAKGDARRAWLKFRPDPELQCRILATLALMKRCDQWTRDEGRFIPHPATWLNREGWEDQPEVERPPAPPPLPTCDQCDQEAPFQANGRRLCEKHYALRPRLARG